MKSMMWATVVAMVWIGLGGRSLAGTTQPAGSADAIFVPAPPAMTGDFVSLTFHSMFVKGWGVITPPPSRETVLVLRGCANTDGKLTGFLEDSRTNQRVLVHEGDAVAGGRIVAITLDYVEYQSPSGRRYHVSVGQNLIGNQVFGANAGTLPTVNPGVPNIDTIRKLAADRQAEMNGSK
jgi:hypothetical protein